MSETIANIGAVTVCGGDHSAGASTAKPRADGKARNPAGQSGTTCLHMRGHDEGDVRLGGKIFRSLGDDDNKPPPSDVHRHDRLPRIASASAPDDLRHLQ